MKAIPLDVVTAQDVHWNLAIHLNEVTPPAVSVNHKIKQK
jgi:hypothetical protein